MLDPFKSHSDWIVPHTRLLLKSYRHWLGKDLIPPEADLAAEARVLFEAPFVLVSGGAEEDQILNYGNAAALRLWETDWETLRRTPSRLTAEPVHQAVRAEFLRRVRERGYVDDYAGVRISSRGRRFRIEQATVWNLIDEKGGYAGQAAMFPSWTHLD